VGKILQAIAHLLHIDDILYEALILICNFFAMLVDAICNALLNLCFSDIVTKFKVDPVHNFIPLFTPNKYTYSKESDGLWDKIWGFISGESAETVEMATEKGAFTTGYLIVFQVIGVVLVIVLISWYLYRQQAGIETKDSPFGLAIRAFFSVILCILSYRIMYIFIHMFWGPSGSDTGGIAGMVTDMLQSISGDKKGGGIRLEDGVFYNIAMMADWSPLERYIGLGTISSVHAQHFAFGSVFPKLGEPFADLLKTIIAIILEIAMLISVVKLFIEVAERWVMANVYYLIAPIAFACSATSDTVKILGTFIRNYFTQMCIMIMNIWFIQAFVLMVNNYSNDPNAQNGWTNVTFCIVLLGMVNACTRIDSWLRDMGIGTARAGMTMSADIKEAYGYANRYGAKPVISLASKGKSAVTGELSKAAADAKSIEAHKEAVGKKEAGNSSVGPGAFTPEARTGGKTLDDYKFDGDRAAQEAKAKKMPYQANWIGPAADIIQEHADLHGGVVQTTGTKMAEGSNGTGHMNVLNTDGSISSGSLSYSASKGAVNIAKNGRTPLYFTPDTGSAPLGGTINGGMKAGDEPMPVDEYIKTHEGSVPNDFLDKAGVPQTTHMRMNKNGTVSGLDEDGNETIWITQRPTDGMELKNANPYRKEQVSTVDQKDTPLPNETEMNMAVQKGGWLSKDDIMNSHPGTFSQKTWDAYAPEADRIINRGEGEYTLAKGNEAIVSFTPSQEQDGSYRAVYEDGEGGQLKDGFGRGIYGSTESMPSHVSSGEISGLSAKPTTENDFKQADSIVTSFHAREAQSALLDRLNGNGETVWSDYGKGDNVGKDQSFQVINGNTGKVYDCFPIRGDNAGLVKNPDITVYKELGITGTDRAGNKQTQNVTYGMREANKTSNNTSDKKSRNKRNH